MSPTPEPHPSGEAAILAGALRAHIARAGRTGRRRLARPKPAPPQGQAVDPVAELRARAAACEDLAALEREVAACSACSLCQTRKQTVFGVGSGRAGLMFVGEAPGADEDASGVPFVGRAGAMLTDIITKGIGMERDDVYIANVLKCRPPENRDPSREEKALCTGWLDRQIELLDPRVIVPLGRHASGHLLRSEASMGRMRGRVHPFGKRKIVPTYHPAYLLRSPSNKKDCWADIQLAMKELNLKPPGRPGGDSSGSR